MSHSHENKSQGSSSKSHITVHDIVANLHVLDDLGHTQRHRTYPPRQTPTVNWRPVVPRQPSPAPAPLRRNGAANAAGVPLLITRVSNVAADDI